MTKISMFFASPLSTVLVSQITQVVEGKKTKNFESIQIPDVHKVGGHVCFYKGNRLLYWRDIRELKI